MLSREDNIRLTRVSRGTPMGELMRRYWQPALLSEELPEPDCAPIRVRLLGEDLIAFRDTTGKVGLVDAFCPHRRAPMFYGRNEECGLRCVYHGWKFDADGNCVDLPTEPSSSKMKDHIKILSYPTYEKADVIWAYMGPKEDMPAPPDYEWMRSLPTHRHVNKTYEQCNWLQALEGGLDTAHSSYLHRSKIWAGTELRQRDGAPHLEVERTDCGYTYISNRNLGEDGNYIRVYQFVLPHQQMRGSVMKNRERWEVPRFDGHFWVPIDDTHTWTYNWACSIGPEHVMPRDYIDALNTTSGRGPTDYIPGTYFPKRNLSNDYLIDRQMQKTVNFTGIVGVSTQDFALQESMGSDTDGPICDRTGEHLGSTDKAIIAMRNQLLEATKDVEAGRRPRGVEPASHRNVRAFDSLIPPNTDWRTEMEDDLRPKW